MNRSIHKLASEDPAEAVRFYRREAAVGLAKRFLVEFEHVAKLLERHPGLGTATADGRKAHPVADIPYSIIYRPEASGLRILVIRHQNRDPEHGENRR